MKEDKKFGILKVDTDKLEDLEAVRDKVEPIIEEELGEEYRLMLTSGLSFQNPSTFLLELKLMLEAVLDTCYDSDKERKKAIEKIFRSAENSLIEEDG